MNHLFLHIVSVLLLLSAGAFAQHSGTVVHAKHHRGGESASEPTLREHIQSLNDVARERLTDGISMSPSEYSDTLRALFRADRWDECMPLLIAAEREWGLTSDISFLYGRYWYHQGDVSTARRYLLTAVREDESNAEALELLVKLEEGEKNYSTAIVHVNDLLGFSPYNPRLWRKKIELYRLSGNEQEANRLLERLAQIYPQNEQIQNDLQYQRELQVEQMRKQGNEQESQQAIRELIQTNPKDAQYYLDLSASLLKEGRMDEAAEVCAKGVNNTGGNRQLIRRRVSILQDQAQYQEAEIYLDDCIRRYHAGDLDALRRYLHEEAAMAADNADAYTRYQHLYGETQSEESLDWLINTAMRREWWGDAEYYLQQAQTQRGKNKDILNKQYTVEKRMGNDKQAARILEELYIADPADSDIRELIAERRLQTAGGLMQDEQWDNALTALHEADTLTRDSDMLAVIERRIRTCEAMLPDTTVVKDSLDQMQHSVIYEKEHNLDSAYACLMRYRPSVDEYHEVQRHRYTLQSRLMKNNLLLEYQYARRTSVDEWSHNAYVTYTRTLTKHDALEVSAAYAGREGASWTETTDEGTDTTYVSAGGTGVQLGAGYYHYFDWGDIGVQATWASRFLPKASVKMQLTENLPAEWTLTERLSWRYITDETRYHVFSAGLSAGWSVGSFLLTPSIDAFLMQKHVYFNGGLKMNYYPLEGDRSNVFASVGVGNAPELTLLDSNLPVRFAHLNTNVSVGGMYLINGHFALTGSIDWYVMGNNDASVRNYIYLHVGLNIFF
ncbi:MAG: hypothetical protein IJ776_08030 [Paludibacteraceae bacterium]|nr:hypothetical protein [Paludibacteraceae bacterium]